MFWATKIYTNKAGMIHQYRITQDKQGGNHMKNENEKFTDQSIAGQVLSEYVIVIALIAISTIGLFAAIGA